MTHHVLTLFCTLHLFTAPSDALVLAPVVSQVQSTSSATDHRVEAIDITLYPGMARVREVLRFSLEAGVVEVNFAGRPYSVPASTDVRAVDDLGLFRVLALDCPNRAMGDVIARVETAAGDRALELSYVSTQMSWSATYTATLPADQTDATLVGYAHIANHCGRAFPDATMRLVTAVSSNFPGIAPDGSLNSPTLAPLSPAPETPLSLKPIFEVQSIDIAPTTVRDGYDKVIEFMRMPGVPIQVEHEVTFGHCGEPRSRQERERVAILAVFLNDATNGLGRTLPAGAFRLLMTQSDGQRAMVGIGHLAETRPGDLARVRVANDSEVIATRTLIGHDGDRRTRSCERTYRVELRNQKTHDVKVNVQDPSIVSLLRATLEESSVSTTETAFAVIVPASASAEVIYTALYRCE